MRPIDADEFKKLLLKERDAIPKLIFDRYDFGVGRKNHNGDLIRAGIRKALRCMEQTPTIEAEHMKWISVEDRLPTTFVSVLGYMTDAGEFPAVRECYCIGGNEFYFPALFERHPVSHWMPMPEPPEERRDDDGR